jgi:hypothetical protein
MAIVHSRIAEAWFVLGVFVLSGIVSTAARAQAPAVETAATQILQRITDYLGSLQQFSVHTRNTLEDLLDSGQWTVPLGTGVGHIFHFGKLPVNRPIGAYYNVVRPDDGPDWQLRV